MDVKIDADDFVLEKDCRKCCGGNAYDLSKDPETGKLINAPRPCIHCEGTGKVLTDMGHAIVPTLVKYVGREMERLMGEMVKTVACTINESAK